MKIRQILTYALTITLASTGSIPAFGHEAPPPPVIDSQDYQKQISDADDYLRSYADLEQAGAGQPKSSLAPDRFLLMQQSVYPKEIPVVKTFVGHAFRRWKLKALLAKTQTYMNQLASADSIKQDFPVVMTVSEIRSALREHLETGRRSDTPLFLWERRKDQAQLKTIFAVLRDLEVEWNRNEAAGLANATNAPLKTQTRAVNWWDLQLQIQKGDEVVQTVRLENSATGHDISSVEPVRCGEGSDKCRFNLMRGNTLLHVFGVPSNVIATFEQFVIFADKDNYDAETGVQYVSFLDLASYNALIGNEDIPIFRMPLKLERPIESLKAVNGKLVVNGQEQFEKSVFEMASDVQQVAFNLQANLVTPEAWANVLPLVDSVQEYFKKTLDAKLQEATESATDKGETRKMLEGLGQELQRHLDTMKTMKPLSGKEVQKLDKRVKETQREAIVQENTPHAQRVQESAELLKLYHQRVQDSSALANIVKKTQQRIGESRKFSARARLLVASLLSPRPFASQKIKEALGVWFMHRPAQPSEKVSWMSRLLRLSDSPYVNAGVLTAAIASLAAPHPFHYMITNGLSLSTGVLDYTVATLHGLSEATYQGSSAILGMVSNPVQNINTQYVANNNWARTLIGTSALFATLSALYFVPHFIFNLAALRKEMKTTSVQAFIERQNNFRKQYFERLAAEEGERRDMGDKVKFSAEEEAEIQNFLKQRQAEIDQRGSVRGTFGKVVRGLNPLTLIQKAKAKVKGWFGYKDQEPEILMQAAAESKAEELSKVMDASEKSLAIQKAESDSPDEFKNFWGALKHFAFSRPSFELTLQNWASIWNSWAGWRFTSIGFGYVRVLGSEIPLYIKLKPVTFAARMVYPEFFKTVVFRRGGRAVLPTELNGGLKRDLIQRCSRSALRTCNSLAFTASPELQSSRAQLRALEAFEDQIIEVEDQVVEVAFRASLESLSKYMQNPKDLQALFGTTPLASITRKEIKDLSWGARTFLRANFESVYHQAMSGFLSQRLGEMQSSSEPDAKDLNILEAPAEPTASDFDPLQETTHRALIAMKREMQRLKAEGSSDTAYNFNPQSARAFAQQIAQDPRHYRNALAAVNRGRLSPANYNMNLRYDLVADMDPAQNRSMQRVEVVRQRLQSPSAVGRAVRAELSKLKLTFPIDLTTKFFLSAGIFAGQLKPIQESMFGPNSTFYLSSTSFYMMMASGVFMGMMGDAWVKLQMDARQDDMGQFGAIPKGEDAQKSFLSWYRKQYSAPENSIVKQWSFSNYLSFWNMPAALANNALFYFMFSGRIDVSLLISGYAICYLTPAQAFGMKIDQAFERASLFAARGIENEKWLAHPEVQQMLIPETQRLRDRFTVVKDIYLNVQANTLGAIEMVPTSLGSRGFQRALMGGGLAEEYLVNYALDPLQKIVTGIPVLNHVATPLIKGCELLLTHGNDDLRLHR